MQWLRKLLGLNPNPPTKADIKVHAEKVAQEADELSQVVHEQKNQYTADLLTIQKKAKIITQNAEEINQLVQDTAYKIAQATGGLK